MKKLAALIITVFAFAAFGFTLSPDKLKSPDDFDPQAKLVEDLKLSTDQLSKFNDLHYNHKLMMIDTKAEIEKNKLEVKRMMMENKIDADKVLKLTEANNSLRSKIHTSRIKMWLDVYKILNKDQQEIWTKHFGRMGEGRNHKMGRGKCMQHGQQMGPRSRDFDEDSQMRPRDGRGKF